MNQQCVSPPLAISRSCRPDLALLGREDGRTFSAIFRDVLDPPFAIAFRSLGRRDLAEIELVPAGTPRARALPPL